MNLAKEEQALYAALDEYAKRLDAIPDNLFGETPPIGGWSFAEVYAHLLRSSIGIARAINDCVNKNVKPTKKGLSFIGVMILGLGRFPPVPVKSPKEVDELFPAEKLTKEDARNLLAKARRALSGIKTDLFRSSGNYAVKHPVMGYLNARQWYKFVRIHCQHHLKQLDRISQSFGI